MTARPIGIMAAMPEELESVVSLMVDVQPVMVRGRRSFHRGTIKSQSVVAVFSRCGKVAATATATELIVRFDVHSLLFTGLAGGMGDSVRVGDMVIPETLMQHDLDARPLFPRFEVPLMEQAIFKTDDTLRERLITASEVMLRNMNQDQPSCIQTLHGGLIASGDQFIGTHDQRLALRSALPGVVAVDMESAAVAQVASDYDIPYAVSRVVSDTADNNAEGAFLDSLGSLAANYTRGIFERFFES